MFCEKNDGRRKIFRAGRRKAVWTLNGGDGAKLAGPVVSGFQQHLPDRKPCGFLMANLLSESQNGAESTESDAAERGVTQ